MPLTQFDPIDSEDVHQAFPKFYDCKGRFFEIIHKEQPIGFVGVRPVEIPEPSWLFQETCELEVFVLPQYRCSLTKILVFAVLDFPRTLKFRRCVMTTMRPGLLKWLHFLVNGGRMEKRFKNGTPYFVRHYS